MKLGFLAIIFAGITVLSNYAIAQSTAFNFQGRMNEGSAPANGRYDLQFKLFDAITGGTQLGPSVVRSNTTLIDGVFGVQLDFGSSPYIDANQYFLEIGVRPNGSSNPHVILGARQQVLSVPIAVRSDRSRTSGQADLATVAIDALNANQATTATTAVDSQKLGGTAASEFVKRNFVNNGTLRMLGNVEASTDLSVGRNLQIVGNATQNNASFGIPKAMLYGQYSLGSTRIGSCYNGFTGASAPDACGFILTEPLGNGVGVYRIDFGFPARGRFVSVTPIHLSPTFNWAASIRFVGDFLEIFTYTTSNSSNTTATDFTVVIY